MYRKIIVGYDASDQAKDALALGELLAGAGDAELVVAGVFPFDPLWGEPDLGTQEAEIAFARQIEQAAGESGATAEAVPSSSAARGLHELAEELGADLIVVGASGRSKVGRALLGAVGVALLHGSPCAVAVAPRGYRELAESGIAAVVVGFDGSAESRTALEAGSELARALGAELKLVSATEFQPPDAALQTRRRLEEARDALAPGVPVEAFVVSGDPAEALAEAAAEPGSLLVLGSRGYGPLRRVMLGSVARELVRSAPAPVVVYPRGAREEPRQVRRIETPTVA